MSTNDDEFEGLAMALIFLKKEAQDLNMIDTSQAIDNAIELAFIEHYRDQMSVEQLEKMHKIIERMLYSPDDLLKELGNKSIANIH